MIHLYLPAMATASSETRQVYDVMGSGFGLDQVTILLGMTFTMHMYARDQRLLWSHAHMQQYDETQPGDCVE